MKTILCNLDEIGVKVIATVHDEIVAYIKEDKERDVIHDIMEDSWKLNVPIKAETLIVKNWSEK